VFVLTIRGSLFDRSSGSGNKTLEILKIHEKVCLKIGISSDNNGVIG